MNLNIKQFMAIAITVLGILAISSANLTDLFGPTAAKYIVSASNLMTAIFGGILTQLTGQSSTVKEVLAMPGVEKIDVNGRANSTLAAIAVDPTVDKISPTPAAQAAVEATAAKGN